MKVFSRWHTIGSDENESSTNPNPASEHSPLLNNCHGEPSPSREKSGVQYYKLLLSQPNFIGGIIGFSVFSAIRSSFSTTLPLHVGHVFDWGSLPAGLLFAAIQGPSFILSPFVGWLKDRIGTREPTTIGFAILTPLFWLIGTPGDERFAWANEDNRGPIIYTGTLLAIGIFSTLLNGSGTIEATCLSSFLYFLLPAISALLAV
jgi:MFS family permease